MILNDSHKPDITIIICTHKSGTRLRKIIENISEQQNIQKDEFEVIIVDNRSLDETYNIGCKALTDYGIKGKVLSEDRLGKRFALVLALENTTSDIVAIVDDDNFINKQYLSRALACFRRRPDVGYYGVKTTVRVDTSLPEWWSREHLCYAVGSKYPDCGYLDEMGGDVVWGAGMVFRKEIWTKAYSFYNSNLAGRNANNLVAGEDSELCLLARLLGWRGYYDTDNIVDHYMPSVRLTEEYLYKLNWSFGVAAIKNKILIEEINFRKKRIYWFRTAMQRNRNFLILFYKYKQIIWQLRGHLSRISNNRVCAYARASGYQGCVDELHSTTNSDLWSFPITDVTINSNHIT